MCVCVSLFGIRLSLFLLFFVAFKCCAHGAYSSLIAVQFLLSPKVILRYAHIIIFATISSFRHLLPPPPSSSSSSPLLLKPILFFEPNYFFKQNIARTKTQSQKSVRHAIKFSIKMSVDCVVMLKQMIWFPNKINSNNNNTTIIFLVKISSISNQITWRRWLACMHLYVCG